MKNTYCLKSFYKLIALLSFFLISIMLFLSCESYLEIDAPRNEISRSDVFSEDATAISSLDGIYSELAFSSFASGDLSSITYVTSFSSDEMTDFSGEFEDFEDNGIDPENQVIDNSLWGPAYRTINSVNNVLVGLEEATQVTDSTRNTLIGEALFVRAFCHFYLVNLFGEVPIITSVDFETNRQKERDEISSVYDQIVSDLLDAQDLLPSDFLFSNSERIRPNKWAATALLARAYLYQEDWENAELVSSEVIESGIFSLEPNLNEVFNANSSEAIWQLVPNEPSNNTNEALGFIFTSVPPPNGALTVTLINSFESGDNRSTEWIGSLSDGTTAFYYPFKYQDLSGTLSEYSMVLRFAELFLIRAEARARLNNLQGALTDLNIIRNRAGLSNAVATDINVLLNQIYREKQLEFFTEWGHRWFDLKRTGEIDNVLGSLKGSDWQPTDALYPIPFAEIQVAPNLTQNPGY